MNREFESRPDRGAIKTSLSNARLTGNPRLTFELLVALQLKTLPKILSRLGKRHGGVGARSYFIAETVAADVGAARSLRSASLMKSMSVAGNSKGALSMAA